MNINIEFIPTADTENTEAIKEAVFNAVSQALKSEYNIEVKSEPAEELSTFEVIYQILEILDSHMDDDFNIRKDLNANDLGISDLKLEILLEIMAEGELIDYSQHPTITLKGLEYLTEKKYL